MRLLLRQAAALTAVGATVGSACGGGDAPTPFLADVVDGGSDAAAPPDAARPASRPDSPEGLGGPCVDDAQCDDGVPCTFDACDESLGRCRATPDDLQCADAVFCDGVEVCDLQLGCRDGEPFDCSDGSTCTIDACDEETRACSHRPRDADGDGDPDVNCDGGADCNERDPRVSGLAPEVCGNGIDDDCDAETDEESCVDPQYDACIDALEISGTGRWELQIEAASSDYAASCVEVGSRTRDLVAALVVPDSGRVDVDVRATARSGDVQLAVVETCGDPSSESLCAATARTPGQTNASRLRLRAPDPGPHALLVFSNATAAVTLDVRYVAPEPEPPNETCGSALPLEPGVPVHASLVDATTDVATECDATAGDLLYYFDLVDSADVRLVADGPDGLGEPSVSLRTEACSAPEDEIACRTAAAGELFWRGLSPGRYFVAVSATGPTDVDLVLSTAPPSETPPDEGCDDAPEITPNVTRTVELAAHVDDVRLGCSSGLVDAAYTLDLTERSDVLVVQRITNGDLGVVAIAEAACDAPAVSCSSSRESPNRTSKHDLAPGSYRIVTEVASATTTTLMTLTRPARAPVLVAFAEDCAAAVDVPSGGAFFIGNTANAIGDVSASCDSGGFDDGGAADQFLRLNLPEARRVIMDMRGSSYATLLAVRRGPECPGAEVEGACSAGYVGNRSYLDVELAAGTYFLQVDGYAGAAGPWLLDLYVVGP